MSSALKLLYVSFDDNTYILGRVKFENKICYQVQPIMTNRYDITKFNYSTVSYNKQEFLKNASYSVHEV